MRAFIQAVTVVVLGIPFMGFPAARAQTAEAITAITAITPQNTTATSASSQPRLLMSYTLQPTAAAPQAGGLPKVGAATSAVNTPIRQSGLALDMKLPQLGAGPMPDLERAAAGGDAHAQVTLAVKYAFAEGVPKDQHKANELFCRAAKYGHADGLYNLGWVYANGRGVPRDDGVAARLFGMAAERGHAHASQLLTVIPQNADVPLPVCLVPAPLPVAVALPPPAVAEEAAETVIRTAPQQIMQLVQRLAPQYEVDSNLVLAVISVESAFNPAALSPANAQGLMQLIPETAERFGVKRPFNSDENIRGGLAYLRWLLAYFQGDVPLVLAAYNAGERAVEKYRGIPPYAETRDYVRKITSLYRKATHPYNATVVTPSPVFAPSKTM